jgi:hypothetical protein
VKFLGTPVAALAFCFITGCSVGIKPDSGKYPHIEFTVNVGYQEAYRRADTFARHCHTSTSVFKGSFNVGGNLFTDNKSGVVRVNLPRAGRDLELIDIQSSGNGSSTVKVTVWGVGIWDEQEMQAAKHSILSDIPTCK